MHSERPSDFAVTVCGEVIAIRFNTEDEVALFIPETSDVIRCSFTGWDALCHSMPKSLDAHQIGFQASNSAEQSKLQSMLIELGAFIG